MAPCCDWACWQRQVGVGAGADLLACPVAPLRAAHLGLRDGRSRKQLNFPADGVGDLRLWKFYGLPCIVKGASVTNTPKPTDAPTADLISHAPKPIVSSSINTYIVDNSETKTQKSMNKNRTRPSPKRSAKKLFLDENTKDDDGDRCADGAAVAAEPSAGTEDN